MRVRSSRDVRTSMDLIVRVDVRVRTSGRSGALWLRVRIGCFHQRAPDPGGMGTEGSMVFTRGQRCSGHTLPYFGDGRALRGASRTRAPKVWRLLVVFVFLDDLRLLALG